MPRVASQGLRGRRWAVVSVVACFLFRSRVSSDNLVFQCITSVVPLAPKLASLQLSATDVSARTTMKGAAKCDKHCELQNSVNH